MVKENRYILSTIIDCIKSCSTLEITIRGHNKISGSINPEIFLGFINFSTKLDFDLKMNLEQALKVHSKKFKIVF